MKELQQTLRTECYGKDLEQRRHWYSPASAAYNQVRPRYPQELIDRVADIAQLSANSRILEVGCGPATATTSFAALGCAMVCVEPNPDFFQLAQQNCQPYPHVEIQNCSFEEWNLEPGKFDAVLAASSFHWIPPDVGYPKASQALRPDGHLILLWNKELQPSYDIYQQLAEVYQIHAPSILRPYEDRDMQVGILNELAQMAIDSGYFKDTIAGHIEVEMTYSIDQYLMLLNTYSPHLKLEVQQKQNLFEGLRQVLEQNGEMLQLSLVSAFHVAKPVVRSN
jgi:SAM-dependent methyltransferase